MLQVLMRSARGRVAAGLVTAAAIGFATPAAAGSPAENEGGGGPAVSTGENQPVEVDPATPTETCEPATGGLPARLIPDTVDLSVCDLRGSLVQAGSLAVRVPHRAGRGATASSLVTEDAPASAVTRLTVVNTGGAVRVDVVRLGADGRAARGGQGDSEDPERSTGQDALPGLPLSEAEAELDAAGGCTRSGYAYLDTHNTSMTWYFDADSVPAYLSEQQAEQAITDGARRTATGVNDCGLSGLTGMEQRYAGTTGDGVDCRGPDGRSVVDFGPRPTGTLATTCWWWNRTADGVREVYEVDTRFQDDPGTFYYTEPDRCAQRYQLTGIATHEFGHAFGLAHISEERYPHQTMSTVAPTCSDAQETLGRGDWLGLRNLYGG